MSVTPLQAYWGAQVNGEVSVDANGGAQCAAGASGTYSIGAWVDLPVTKPIPCPIGRYGEPVCYTALGTAQSTCP
jgi:hypothetical protein